MTHWIEVCKRSDLQTGKGKTVWVNDRDLAIYEFDGEVYALLNKCPHRGGQLADGHITENGNVICPLHSWDFDVRTGVSRYDNKDTVPIYPARYNGDVVEVDADAVPMGARGEGYLSDWARRFDDREHEMHDLHMYAGGRKELIEPMRTARPVPNFDSIYFLPGQLAVLPLLDDEPVTTETVIGNNAAKPLKLKAPIYVSHMSFGALSIEAKRALARGTRLFGTVICSGEGGMHPDERAEAEQYIFEMASGYFGWSDENIARADGIEIKMGQSAKAGLGGLLPGKKVTEEIARVRGIPVGETAHSPARFRDINNLADMKQRIAYIRSINPGIPVGIKFAASRIEADLAAACDLGVDFITLDGRGGGTGAAPVHVKDHIGVPAVFAIPRARKWLDDHGHQNITLCVTGGFRTSADVAKALALGADVVAMATASMMAIGCQQYRACHNNTCPVGIATQKPELRARFDIEKSAQRLLNFFENMRLQLIDYARMCGKRSLFDLSPEDLATTDSEIAAHTPIPHV
jgi:glutamate synthase domain-containing protein 2/nitrite reductase/ring-hydroxylating ferredoxin subunit